MLWEYIRKRTISGVAPESSFRRHLLTTTLRRKPPTHPRCSNTLLRPAHHNAQRHLTLCKRRHHLVSKSELEVAFRLVRAATSSLACKTETEVVFMGFRPPFSQPPPPSHARARRGRFSGVSTPFAPPPAPSLATAKQRWFLWVF